MSRDAVSSNVESVQPLSPVQQDILSRSLSAAGPGAWITRLSCRLEGVRRELFERAWQAVVDRHAILRTAFAWKNPQKLRRVVGRWVGVPILREDWRELSPAVRDDRWAELLDRDRRSDLDLAKAPVMRLTLVRCSEEGYLFLWSVHSIVLDRRSSLRIFNEVLAVHAALCSDRQPPSPGDRDEGKGLPDPEAAAAFWRRMLGGASGPTRLPGSGGVERGRSRRDCLRLSAGPAGAAEAFAFSHGLTLDALAAGAWALLLSRYGGDADVVFGIEAAGGETLGPSSGPLPLRVRLTADQPVLPWLREIQRLRGESLPSGQTPLTEIRRWSGWPDDQPLYESALSCDTGGPPPESMELRVDDLWSSEAGSVPIHVLLTRSGTGLALEICRETPRFDPAAAGRLLHHFAVLFEGVAADPERPLGGIPLLGLAERHQIEREWNDTGSALPHRVVHAAFSAWSARSPGAPALVFDGREMSYGELERRSNQLAWFLRWRGVGAEVRVGLCLHPSLEVGVALLGILKAGGAYVPLDAAYPAERLAFMVADADVSLVLTQESLRGYEEEIARFPEGPLALDVSPESLAYVMYTSGSTGVPKGIGIPHRAICRLVLATNYLPFGPEERVGQASNLSFDAATFEIWGALLNGGTLVGVPREAALSPAGLATRIREGGITALFLTPALFNQVVRASPEAFAPLRHLLLGGEAVDPALAREALGRHAPGRLLNGYGPTESTTFATWFHIAEVAAEAVTVPIGRPLSNSSAHVVDRAGRTAPLGVLGELLLGGEGLARCYVGQPDLTAASFVPDPFGSVPGGRLYRTGDLVRLRADGNLEILGRADGQVKVRGFRIEPGEIEAALAVASGVEGCAVVAHQERAERRLVAYVVPARGHAPSVEELREHLGRRLPAFMIPALFMFLDVLPLTTNGKVDRRALPAPGPSRPDLAAALVEPRGEVEERLAAVWAEVLRLERVGVHDNFFELGGDSILSLQIVARASRLGLSLTPRQVFEHPTVAELAAVAGREAVVRGEQEVVTGEVPLTPIQRWFFARDLPEPHHFNQALLLEVGEPLSPGSLVVALAAVVAHHDALRLRFVGRERAFNAGLPDPATASWVDLAALPAATRAGVVESVSRSLQRSLDLERGPLVRVACFAAGGDEPARLLVVAHHLVVDGVSWRVLVEDLESAWRQSRRGEIIALPPKTTSFRRWAERLEEHALSAACAGELEHWLAVVERPVAPLPVGRPGGGNRVAALRSVTVSLEEEATRVLLQEVPPVYRTEINDVLLTALARGFAGWTGARSLLVDLEGHGREELFTDVDLSRTVGWLTTMFPVLLDLGGTADPGVELKRIKEQLRRVPRRGIGYGLLRYLAGREAAERLDAGPAPEVSFNYLGQLDQALPEGSNLRAARESAGASVSPLGERSHRLEINASVSGGRLRMIWSYSSEIDAPATIESLAAGTLGELRALIAFCRSPEAGGLTPSDVPLARLDEEALDRLLSGEHGIEDVYPLTPLQQGMLFHALAAPASGMYVTQMVCDLAGALDLEAFRQAWQEIVDRHPVLRTGFVWRGLDHPLQIVRRSAAVPLERLDWSESAPAEIRERLDALLADDLRRGFDMERPPLMRVTLIRVAEGSHLCVWSSHHILFDGWCLSLLFRDVLVGYESFRAGRRPDQPRPGPYRAYIAWLEAQDRSGDEAFWRSQLAGFAEPSRILAGEGAGRGMGDGELGSLLPASSTARLQSLARRHRLTLNTLVQGAWALWLSRYSGEDDVVFGATVAGRPAGLPGVETMVGLFINTLPVRVRTPAGEPLLPWLGALQEGQLALRQHEHTPLADVRRWSGLPAGQTLFETLLVFENFPVDPTLRQEAVSLEIRSLRLFERASFPVILAAIPGESLRLRMTYDTSRFDAPSARLMLRHLETLLEGMVADPDRCLGEVPLLTEAELQGLTVEWSDTGLVLPGGTVPELFAAQVARAPEAPAVLCGGVSLSYGELERRADGLAQTLRDLGVLPGSRVGLCLERSAEMVVALLGVWKAGGAWVPFDPAWPSERLALLAEDSGISVLVRSESVMETIAHQSRPVPETAAAVASIAGQPAYLIYTSGTTGRPKAVQVSHGNLSGMLLGCLERFGREDWESTLHLASFSFDIALFELFMPLLSGGCVVLLRREEILDRRSLAAAVGRATALHAVPSLMRQLLEAGTAPWPGVKRVFIGGDTVPADLLVALRPAFPAARITALYGPTEGTILATSWAAPEGPERTLIGRPLPNVRLLVVDRGLRPVPRGVTGELCLGGVGVTQGYLAREELTREKYILLAGERLYRTGDLVRWRADGNLEHLGRADGQVKVRGFRIEPGEIEAALAAHSGVREAVVAARPQVSGEDRRLVAWVVPAAEPAPGVEELREHLGRRLPEHMVPSAFVVLPALPLTANGKVDLRALPAPGEARPVVPPGAAPPGTEVERAVARIWRDVLGRDGLGRDESFFTAGGDSLLLMRLCDRLEQAFGREIPIADLFRAPTIASQASYLQSGAREEVSRSAVEARVAARSAMRQRPGEAVAIIGMAGRFPGAGTLETFWRNLREGVESISFFSAEELRAAGVDPAFLDHPGYVRAKGILQEVAGFDASFFGLTANEATVMDPQHRLFLECAWEALEDAALDPERFPGRISVFAGCGQSSYLFQQLLGNDDLVQALGRLQVSLLNDRDFLATQTAYRLGLSGLAATVQTACSTSLVAVHLACQSLLAGESDAALAGGVSISLPQTGGYLYQEGGVLSPDGHCRAFDAAAKGALPGSGCGVVALKRLSAALADGDPIHAVIRGTAAANDGAARMGFTAPGVEGQMAVIAESLGVAGVEPETIGYVEAHGSGTPLGDPIEISALTRAYRTRTGETGFCPIGSVKTNIGHLDTAAGVAGLIKTVLALEHAAVPPSLHFERPNPQIDFAGSPFYVNARLAPWPARSAPRRAGVSSFGLGGTNVHAVLEQAPDPEPSAPSRPLQLLTLSARSKAALDRMAARLREALESSPDMNLADAAFTLQAGRKAFRHRRAVLCADREDALAKLAPGNARAVSEGIAGSERPLAFLFPGLGNHHPGMAGELYRSEAVVRGEIDRCAEILRPWLGLDLRRVLCEGTAPRRSLLGRRSAAHAGGLGELGRTAIAQPAVFVVEYALARLLMHWGLRPQAMIGYSIGEYVAACLAGVMSLEDALRLVARRARLIENLPAGAMLAVPLAESELLPRLVPGLSLAALDGPHLSVVAGTRDEVAALDGRLAAEGVVCLWLDAAHAFHSHLMEPAAAALRDLASRLALRPPEIPYLSNVTGTWITAEQATDPEYWSRHLCQTVRFGEGLGELLREPGRILAEVGPGSSLSVLVRQHPLSDSSHLAVATLGRPEEETAPEALLSALGRLWTAGVQVDWRSFHEGAARRRLRLPVYPFERQRFWADRPDRTAGARSPGESRPADPGGRQSLRDWFWLPTWRETRAATLAESGAQLPAEGRWLLFLDGQGLGLRIADRLTRAGQTVFTVATGDTFRDVGGGAYTLDPRRRDGYDLLLTGLRAAGAVPDRVLHLWTVAPLEERGLTAASFERWQDLGLHSLLFFVQALSVAAEEILDLRVGVVSTHLQAVLDGEPLVPEKATLLGACRVIPLEVQGIRCTSLDIVPAQPGSAREEWKAEYLIVEMLRETPADEIALRGRQRWVRAFEPLACEPPAAAPSRLKHGGSYLITGGLQPLGLAFAETLACSWAARLVLVADPGFPVRPAWESWLAAHETTDPVSAAIRRVLELERSGTEVTLLAADITDELQLQSVLAAAGARHGRLDGIFHAAVSAANGLIQLRTPESLHGVQGAQARGALLLAALATELPADLVVLCSSLTAVLGGVGQVDLCASGAFLGALAEAASQRGRAVVTAIDWGPLQGVATGSFGIQALDAQLEKNLETFGISAENLGEALRRILGSPPVPHLAVSVRHLTVEIEQALRFTAARVLEDMDRVQTKGHTHARPELSTPYVAPRDEVEGSLAEIWQQLFGIDRAGVTDNFFELSGHSLLAIQMVTRMRERFSVDLPVTVVFEAPTIEGLAARILHARLELLDPEELDAALLLAEIKSLAPDQVRQLLTEEQG